MYTSFKGLYQLFALADAAKAKAQYAIANVVFAIVSYRVFEPAFFEGWEGVRSFYATDDEEGKEAGSLDQVFYDLVGLRLFNKDGGETASMVMPVPLVVCGVALLALKRGPVEERGEHRRETTPATDEECRTLWDELWSIEGITPEFAQHAVRSFLNLEGEAELSAEIEAEIASRAVLAG